ncbi:beta-ketoacyl synthase N-terminal-like domain-containing protein [Gaopeijia maritima]|uniref:Beta-ketoacyl synthase N-terminal-like domain-containing protein n=1 Tax=Gaopeijia maritima TaxID=3119007 RepID=A0ABU9EC07_9BACT
MSETRELTPVKRALVEIRRLREELAQARAAAASASPVDDGAVALVGMAVRVPGEPASVEEFWAQLEGGHDGIRPVPTDRWDHTAVFDAEPGTAGATYVDEGGFLEQVYDFDPEFFGVAALEARSMDPQQRIVLETAWRALDHAGIDPRALADSETGVFLGIANGDYGRLLHRDLDRIDEWSGSGAAFSVASGRLSYLLGLRGPAISIDTACSSSLVAAHLAVRSLREGECDLALIGGVNLILAPEVLVNFSRARMLSPTGRCHTFDAAADGYVRSEGCGVIVARRLADARRDGDRILAVIRGSAVNQDGRSAGLTAPSAPAQERVMRRALADARLTPDDVDAIEAHGTGTSLGDPIELEAIGRVFGTDTRTRPLMVGSVKTNVGHLEAAAGVVGLAKAALALDRGVVPPHLHFSEPNPLVEWGRLPVEVPTRATPLAEGPVHRIGVSSFGFSGTNAHVILESAPPVPASSHAAPDAPFLLPLSARDPESLRELVRRVVDTLGSAQAPFAHLCATAGRRRTGWRERLAVVADDAAAARTALERWLAGDESAVERGTVETEGGQSPRSGTATDRATEVRDAARLWVRGAPVAAERIWGSAPPVDFPSHPWKRRTLRIDAPPAAYAGRAAVISAARERAEAPPTGMDPAAYDRIWSVLGELARGTGRFVLARAGVFAERGARADLDQVLEQAGIREVYRPIVERWLRGLATEGVLERTDGGYRASAPVVAPDLEALRARAREVLADDAALRDYVEHAAALAPDIYTGAVSALESLFPDGSFDLAVRLYTSAGPLRYVNHIAAGAVAALAAARPAGLEVLEVGAGTGGSTGALLEAAGSSARWTYSDVSTAFLDHGRERFGSHPHFRTRLFDLDADPESPDVARGGFDLIVGSNSVHAVRDLPAALARLRRLLAPGGMLVLIETTAHLAWHDVTTGLIEGWQGADDDLRTDGPLLDVEGWGSALRGAGFDEVVAVPGPGSSGAALAQHVVLAFAPGRAAAPAARSDEGAAAAPASEMALEGAASDIERPAPDEAPSAGAAGLDRLLAGAVGSERRRRLVDAVRAAVIEVLHADPDRPPAADARLMELGVDSLLAVRLRNRLKKTLELPFALPSTLIFEHPTIEAIAAFIEARAEAAASAPEPGARAAVDPIAAPAEAASAPEASSILELSDAEVEAMLLAQLEAEEKG